MKEFFLNKILYPLFAIIFCLAFGVPFVYTGFQTAIVQGTKSEAGSTTLDITRIHYGGLIKKELHLEQVNWVSLENSLIRRVGKPRRLVSGVFIETANETERLFAGSSNLDESVKWEAVNQINSFITSPTQETFSETYKIRNIFGWFGLPFLFLGVLGLLGWPFSLFKKDESDD